MDFDQFSIIIIVICLLALVAVIAGIIISTKNQVKVSQNAFKMIEEGMKEETMFEIMGGGYSKSFRDDGLNKYEWTIRDNSLKGKFARSKGMKGSNDKLIIIYTKEGIVTKIENLNI